MKDSVKKYRLDYRPCDYVIDSVQLEFKLNFQKTYVKSYMKFTNKTGNHVDLVLDGENIDLISIKLNDKSLNESDYSYDTNASKLTVNKELLNKNFTIEIENYCYPEANTALQGLYKSNNFLTTQCESNGFRFITFFIDRPDNMSKYRTKIIANKTEFPVLLSNGNIIEGKDLGNDEHMIVYDDPNLKPCYLFALIAGPLEYIEDTYTYLDGPANKKQVKIYVYCEKKFLKQVEWSIECVKKAMEWDYLKMNRIYDLDRFCVVAIEYFNAGAMENKGLTTYNVSCILAHKDTSTDARFQRVSSVIGHEYFHNWSGNRVTVRDWFQITLKEGFTNLREQMFDEYCYSSSVKRIEQINDILTHQFPEDAGPLAHPIRPDYYESVDNFYTMTVYEKGAEVIRMMKTILGEEGFIKGTDHYFSKYDGQAISCDEFRLALSEANNIDLSQFESWYSQKGTPIVKVLERNWNKDTNTYSLTVQQIIPEQDNGSKKNYIIPILTGLIGKKSKKDLLLNNSQVLLLTEEIQTFKLHNINEDCVPSLFRQFSAPVIIEDYLTEDELEFLIVYDSDLVQKWFNLQTIYRKEIIKIYLSNNKDVVLIEPIKKALDYIINNIDDYQYVALSIVPPSSASIQSYIDNIKPRDLVLACKCMKNLVCKYIEGPMKLIFSKLYNISTNSEWSVSKESCAIRALQNTALCIITKLYDDLTDEEIKERTEKLHNYYKNATNFNDRFHAFLYVLEWKHGNKKQNEIIEEMYNICKNDPVMLDSWFASQVSSANDDALIRFKELCKHPDFLDTQNPNRFRALIGAFANNLYAFHTSSGEGYRLVSEQICKFDKINPYVAAIVCKIFTTFTKYEKSCIKTMKTVIEAIDMNTLSPNCKEIIAAAKKIN